jgi:uncharacterized membrane protein
MESAAALKELRRDFKRMKTMVINKKIKGITVLATLVLRSTPLDLFSRGGGGHGGGGHGGGGHGGGQSRGGGGRGGHGNHGGHHGGGHGYGHRGYGYGGWGFGGGIVTGVVVGSLLATSVSLNNVNSGNYNATVDALNARIDELNRRLDYAEDDKAQQLQDALDKTNAQLAQVTAYKDQGFVSTETPQTAKAPVKQAPSESIKTELVDEVEKVEGEVEHLKAEIEADI